MDLLKYETVVMQLGAWKSFEELEVHLTLEELFELYQGVMHTRMEEFKNMARAAGATFKDEESEDEPTNEGGETISPFDKVVNMAKEKAGQQVSTKPVDSSIGMFKINRI